jgi:hypothetical protein
VGVCRDGVPGLRLFLGVAFVCRRWSAWFVGAARADVGVTRIALGVKVRSGAAVLRGLFRVLDICLE